MGSGFGLDGIVKVFYAELFISVNVGIVVKNEWCKAEVVLVCVGPYAVPLNAVGVVLKSS